jgi:hypothetical protein
MTVNYIVHIQDWNGHSKVECETEKEVWEAIGKSSFLAGYQVESPTGKDVSDFVPF